MPRPRAKRAQTHNGQSGLIKPAAERPPAYNEAQAHINSLLGIIRMIGRLSTEQRVIDLCKMAVAGEPIPDDTARLDWLFRAEPDVEFTVEERWRVCTVDGDFEHVDLRTAIDMAMDFSHGG